MQKLMLVLSLALVSASLAFAQETGQIVEGGYEETAVTVPAGQETGAVVPNPVTAPAVVVPNGLTPEEHRWLKITVRNIETLATWPKSLKRTVEFRRQVDVTNNYITRRQIVRQTLSPSQLVQMLKDLGMLRSGASTWGRNDVRFCLDEGILVGRNPGTTTASSEWKTYCTREELATALARMDKRVDGKIATAIAGHNADPASHQDIRKRLDWTEYKVNWILGVLLILALLLLLVWLVRVLWNHFHGGGFAPFAAPAVIPPVVPGAGGAGVPGPPMFPARNGTGIQL